MDATRPLCQFEGRLAPPHTLICATLATKRLPGLCAHTFSEQTETQKKHMTAPIDAGALHLEFITSTWCTLWPLSSKLTLVLALDLCLGTLAAMYSWLQCSISITRCQLNTLGLTVMVKEIVYLVIMAEPIWCFVLIMKWHKVIDRYTIHL